MAITKIQSESLNLADTYAFTGTVTGAGGVNTPYFQATMSATQNISNDVLTKVNFNTASLDSDSDYDTTNKRFTPQTAGKFSIHAETFLSSNTPNNLHTAKISLYKNGSRINTSDWFFDNNHIDSASLHVQGIVDMNGSSDYLEIYALIRTNSGSGMSIYRDQSRCVFQGYKIIE